MFLGLFVAGNEYSIAFSGDLMLNAIKPDAKALAGVRGALTAPDVAFANLEIPLTTARTATTRKTAAELKARKQFVLKADPKHAEFIKAAGIDVVSLANNHGMDYGAPGSSEMRLSLEKVGIKFAGAGDNASEAMKIATFKLADGQVIGLFSAMAFVGRGALLKTTPATMRSPGINVLNFGGVIGDEAKARIGRIVKSAREKCDVLVIGLHWGIERETVPTPYQVSLGRAFIDAGADCVWGHHPHVLQGAEIYSGKPILYSMGNLISPTPAKTAIVTMRFVNGKLSRTYVQPCHISGGRVTIETGVVATNERLRFKNLGLALRKRYPSKASQPFPVN